MDDDCGLVVVVVPFKVTVEAALPPGGPLRSMLFRPRPPRQPRPSSGRSRPLPTSKASSTLISSVRTFTKRLRNTDSRPLEAMLLTEEGDEDTRSAKIATIVSLSMSLALWRRVVLS
jgi:hypothetical protein